VLCIKIGSEVAQESMKKRVSEVARESTKKRDYRRSASSMQPGEREDNTWQKVRRGTKSKRCLQERSRRGPWGTTI
jgi:hypothetical protein